MERIPVDLASLPDEAILRLRFKDLGVSIKGTWLEECVQALYAELAARGITFRPQCYLADEWLTPDGEPVVGIPFYLAHPRLAALEKRMMHDVEGGDRASCMQLLRHEAGHALNYAYCLYRRPRWNALFGRFSTEYPDRYKYRPYSRSFVIHLDDWYAQYHPDEDFAETFAVWLDPESGWRERYRGWKALEKLQYVDELMRETAGKPPLRKKGGKYWDIRRLASTLATHYRKKTEFYAEYSPDFYDIDLACIFPPLDEGVRRRQADRVLAHYRREIVDHVALWTGERKYIIGRLMKNIIGRARELKLAAGPDTARNVLRTASYVTALIMNYVYTGRYKRKK